MPPGKGVQPELLQQVAHVLAHLGGHVDVEAVHAGQGVAAAVHLNGLAERAGLEPGGMGVPVVMTAEPARQAGPGAIGQVSRSVLAVAVTDGDARPGLGGDVDGAAGAVAGGDGVLRRPG